MSKRADTEAVEGRLELCYNRKWFSVQDHSNNYRLNRDIVCQSLGYGLNTGEKCYSSY